MTSVSSATSWGSPTATKHALLIHGLSSSSHTWHRVASSLVAQGYLVTAPNLVGHASRVSPDYRVNAIADDLRPYLEARTYSLIVGHSMGGVIALHLLPYLPRSHPTAIILVDPPLNMSPAQLAFWENVSIDGHVHAKSAETWCAESPPWTREDGIHRELGVRLCPVDTVRAIFATNQPWYYLDLLNDVSEKWEIAILLADPAILKLCPVEDLKPYPHVRPVIVPGAGHSIPFEFPDAIVEEVLKRVAELDVP